MHLSSRLKMEAFLDTYAADSRGKSVLDVGARASKPRKYNYRHSTDERGLVYSGLDLSPGHNVEIVPANPYIWDEIGDEQFDFVISGQAFEHNPFMWISFCEIARVLKQGGRAFIIAPSSGSVHRFPYDCWRYYPDSWAALCAVSGLELTESIREPDNSEVSGAGWGDSAVVATKPHFKSGEAREAFYQNLRENVAPFKARRYHFEPAVLNEGKCFQEYMNRVRLGKTDSGDAAEARPEVVQKVERDGVSAAGLRGNELRQFMKSTSGSDGTAAKGAAKGAAMSQSEKRERRLKKAAVNNGVSDTGHAASKLEWEQRRRKKMRRASAKTDQAAA